MSDEAAINEEIKSVDRHHMHRENIAKNNNKYERFFDRILSDEDIKEVFLTISNARTNFYKKIYSMCVTSLEKWPKLPWLTTTVKRRTMIDMIKQELKAIENKRFNFEKYESVIGLILGLKEEQHFNEPIITNMYVAKLQNIIMILEDADADKSLKESTKSASAGICY
ncbi:MAG: hypothetical protein IJ590_01665 [Rickettsiales bacterium]|nr:hypothetical protein [Rickettsiales bacterium]